MLLLEAITKNTRDLNLLRTFQEALYNEYEKEYPQANKPNSVFVLKLNLGLPPYFIRKKKNVVNGF
jgi:hypothetical protein